MDGEYERFVEIMKSSVSLVCTTALEEHVVDRVCGCLVVTLADNRAVTICIDQKMAKKSKRIPLLQTVLNSERPGFSTDEDSWKQFIGVMQNSVSLVCKDGLEQGSVRKVEGVLAITVQTKNMLVVNIDEVFGADPPTVNKGLQEILLKKEEQEQEASVSMAVDDTMEVDDSANVTRDASLNEALDDSETADLTESLATTGDKDSLFELDQGEELDEDDITPDPVLIAMLKKENEEMSIKEENDDFEPVVTGEAALKLLRSRKRGPKPKGGAMMDDDAMFTTGRIECPVCKKTFKNLNSVKAHHRDMHQEQPVYQRMCRYCLRVFPSRKYLRSHLQHYHPEEDLLSLVCTHCDMGFVTEEELLLHITTAHMEEETSSEQAPTQADEGVNDASLLDQQLSRPLMAEDEVPSSMEESLLAGDEQRLQCGICSKLFKNKDSLKAHTTDMHRIFPQYMRRCRACLKIFMNTKYLRNHYQQHKDLDMASTVCLHCQGSFETEKELLQHVDAIHGPDGPSSVVKRKFVRRQTQQVIPKHNAHCYLCSKNFYDKSCLRLHMRKFHGQDLETPSPKGHGPSSNQCDVCERSFSSHNYLQEHMRKAHGPERQVMYRCSHCERTFKTQMLLLRHFRHQHNEAETLPDGTITLRKRNDGGVHECEVCNKTYNSVYSLRYHMQQHTGAYQYSCHVCGQKFSFKTSFEGHMNVHNGRKPYVCHQCGKSFSYKNSLREHEGSHQLRHCSCNICGKTFTALKTLRSHKRRVHATSANYCQTCGQSFQRAGQLRKHNCPGVQAFSLVQSTPVDVGEDVAEVFQGLEAQAGEEGANIELTVVQDDGREVTIVLPPGQELTSQQTQMIMMQPPILSHSLLSTKDEDGVEGWMKVEDQA